MVLSLPLPFPNAITSQEDWSNVDLVSSQVNLVPGIPGDHAWYPRIEGEMGEFYGAGRIYPDG